jgi:signal transduction histidine kinase
MSEAAPIRADGQGRRLFGIRTRLYFALGGAVAITLAASLIAWFAFLEVETRQLEVTEKYLPALTTALQMAQQSTAIAALAPKLLAFDKAQTRDHTHRQIADERKGLQDLAHRLRKLIADTQQLQVISSNVETLAQSLEALDDVASTRFSIESKLESSAAEMQASHRAMTLVLAPLLDDVTFYVITGYRKLDDAVAAPMVERSNSTQLLAYEAMTQISAEGNLLRGLLSGVVHLPRAEFLQPTRERFDAASGRLARALETLRQHPEISKLRPHVDKMTGFGIGTESLFELRRQILNKQALEQTLLQQSRHSAEIMTKKIRALVQQTEQAANAGTATVSRILTTGQWALLALNIFSLLGAVLIAWLFVDRWLMRRLTALAAKMREMAAGDITIPVESSGNDEVTEMAEALEVFRAHALEVRRLNLVEKLADELNDKNTELQDTLDQLTAAQDRIITQEKLASLGQLTAGIAHEIKNPLNFVNNFSDVSVELIEELRELLNTMKTAASDEARAEIEDILSDLTLNLDRIRKHGQRADGIVRGMLDHSRESTGELERTDVNGLLEEFVSLAYHGIRAQDSSFNVAIEQSYGEDVKPMLVVRQDLGRAFLNIVTNGLQALQEKARNGANDFEPKIQVTTRQVGTRIEIRIHDNGPGIPNGVAEKIFTPFFTTKPAGLGTGLGLSITYDIVVKQHGGALNVTSEVGEFTEFVMELPEQTAAET